MIACSAPRATGCAARFAWPGAPLLGTALLVGVDVRRRDRGGSRGAAHELCARPLRRRGPRARRGYARLRGRRRRCRRATARRARRRRASADLRAAGGGSAPRGERGPRGRLRLLGAGARHGVRHRSRRGPGLGGAARHPRRRTVGRPPTSPPRPSSASRLARRDGLEVGDTFELFPEEYLFFDDSPEARRSPPSSWRRYPASACASSACTSHRRRCRRSLRSGSR